MRLDKLCSMEVCYLDFHFSKTYGGQSGHSHHRSAGDAAHAVDPFRPDEAHCITKAERDPPTGYGTWTTVILNSPTAPGTPRLPRL
jgi:hypothetical protein